ncbi:MAG: histidine kinase [Haliscomenobacter sp.]|nr:histidine kinase [Haliscomenobacter sp.]
MFNSLNTLIYLIPESPERAVEFVQKLAKVYRYVLEIQDKKLIALSEELSFLKAFTHLLKERFGDGFEVHVQVDEQAYGLQIVPLSLQILVENALKHNVVSVEKPLHIRIEDKNGFLEIRNNLQLREPAGGSTKLGLLNIRNRFAFFSDRQVDIWQNTEEFCVILPLLSHTLEAPV